MKWFNRNVVRYNEPHEPQTPFAKARQEWDDRLGSLRAQADHWRRGAWASLSVAGLLGVGLAWVGAQTRVATYIVEVDQTGKPGRIQLLEPVYRPDKNLAGHFIGRLVEQVRAIPSDPVVLSKNFSHAYRFITGTAKPKMDDYGRGLESLIAEKATRSVEVQNVLEASETSFQVTWSESTYRSGALTDRKSYIGLFTYLIQPPRDEQEVYENPLGVYLTDFNWSENFDVKSKN